MALFLFEFSKATRGEAGSVTWRNLIPPPAKILANSPSPDQYHPLTPPGNEALSVLVSDPWESTAAPSINLCSEGYDQGAYNPANSPSLEMVTWDPTYLASLSRGLSNESALASLESTGQLDCFPYDNGIPYVTLLNSSQQYMSQWQQYPSPLSENQFPVSRAYPDTMMAGYYNTEQLPMRACYCLSPNAETSAPVP